MQARSKTSILAPLAAFVLFVCSQEPPGLDSNNGPPVLPPVANMQFDLSFFDR